MRCARKPRGVWGKWFDLRRRASGSIIYAYANNNPNKFVDPDGRDPVDSIKAWWSASVAGFQSEGPLDAAMRVLQALPVEAGAIGAVGVVKGTAASAEQAAVSLSTRVEELHGVLDSIAAGRRTTAALDTVEGTRVLAAGGRDLSPAQRALMVPGEVAAKLPGAHAEVTALEHAAKNGLTPSNMSVSRTICSSCAASIEQSGGRLTSPTTAEWPR